MSTRKERILKAHAEVERGSPGARERLERLQAEFRTSGITRVGGTCTVVDGPRTRSTMLPSGEQVRFYPSLAPVHEVTITTEARKQIDAEFNAMLTTCRAGLLPSDYAETGGWLLVDPQRPLRIVVATGPGDLARYGENSIQFDPAAAGDAKRAHPGLRIAGDWHLHPGSSGLPSARRTGRAGQVRSGSTGSTLTSG